MQTASTGFGRIGRQMNSMEYARAYPPSLTTDAKPSLMTMDQATMDAFSNALARTGWGTPSLLEATDYPLTRLTRNYVLLQSLYRSHWIVRQIISAVPEDMIKGWVDIKCQITPDQIDDFEKSVENTETPLKILTALKWGRLFGGAGAVIIIKGHENILDKPLNLEDVELDSYRGLLVFDRWSGISPNAELNSDIDNPVEFGLPKSYLVTTEMGKAFNVHSSRVLRFCGRDLPQWEWQAEWRWGLSEIEAIFDELRKRDNTSWSAANLMYRANIMAMKVKDVTQMLSLNNAASQQRLANVLSAQNKLMSNQGLMVLDADGGGLEQHQYAFGGVSELLQTQMMDLAGACEIPASRLFGRAPEGMNATGEGDERNYYDSIEQKRNAKLRPQLRKLFPVICMSTWGKIPKDFDFGFSPLHSPSEKERAELTQQYATAITTVYNAGLTSQKISLKELRQTADVTGVFSNITDDDIENADDTLKQPDEINGLGDMGNPTKSEPYENPFEKNPFDKMVKETQDSKSSPVLISRTFAGFPVVIEYPAGMRRVIKNDAGNVVYDRLMKYDYGYIAGTVGRDGDEIDVILGPNESAPYIFIIDMHDQGPDIDKREDEDKVMLGYRNFEGSGGAREAFISNYPRHYLGSVQSMPVEQYREALLGVSA